MNGSWDAYLSFPADFTGADDIITNLAKEREPGIEISECTPLSLIITRHVLFIVAYMYANCVLKVNANEVFPDQNDVY